MKPFTPRASVMKTAEHSAGRERSSGREDSQSLCPPRVTVGEPRAAPLASSGRLEQKLLGEAAPPPPRWDW